MIGSVGYYGKRQYGHTPVYRLHTQTFAIEIVECTGDAPGWISRHTARLRLAHEIEIRSGKVLTSNGDTEDYEDNDGTFVLDVERRAWRRL